MKLIAFAFFLSTLPLVAGAQVESRTQTPAPAPSVASELSPILGQLQQTAEAINLKVARLRIEKWKADSASKQQAQQNAESISRNLTAALPGIMEQVRANPLSLAAQFKLYRNVSALYDVFAGLTEAAGAFGPKSDYDALASEAANLDNVRRAMGDKIENLAAARDTEIVRLRTQVTHAAAAAPPPPKKIVIDDAEKPKKPAAKRKTKPATPNAPATTRAQ